MGKTGSSVVVKFGVVVIVEFSEEVCHSVDADVVVSSVVELEGSHSVVVVVVVESSAKVHVMFHSSAVIGISIPSRSHSPDWSKVWVAPSRYPSLE